MIGTAGGLLQAAGSIFGGLLGSAGNSTYEIQRAIGGPAHDRALQQAVDEVKQKFRRCQRCGNWVCAEICWNQGAAQCTACNPKYEQEAISLRTQAQILATRQQMQEKALTTDYVSGIDMNPDATIHLNSGAPQFAPQPASQPAPQFVPQTAPQAAPLPPVHSTSFLPSSWQTDPSATQTQPANQPAPWQPVETTPPPSVCTACATPLHGSKFCPNCGTPTAPPAARTCPACGHISPPSARFCEDCGGKLP